MQTFHKIVLSLSHNFATNQSNADFFKFLHSAINNVSFPKILKVEDPFGEKFKFFIHLGTRTGKDVNHINKRIKLQSFRALK